MLLESLRFQKYDKYENYVFIASINKLEEETNYNILQNIHNKLEGKYESYLPLYKSDMYNYVSVTIRKNYKFTDKLVIGNTYNVEFDIREVEKDDKIYVNCTLKKIKLHTRKPKENLGSIIEF